MVAGLVAVAVATFVFDGWMPGTFLLGVVALTMSRAFFDCSAASSALREASAQLTPPAPPEGGSGDAEGVGCAEDEAVATEILEGTGNQRG